MNLHSNVLVHPWHFLRPWVDEIYINGARNSSKIHYKPTSTATDLPLRTMVVINVILPSVRTKRLISMLSAGSTKVRSKNGEPVGNVVNR